jgi:uncharacterized protein (TIGR03663 family)
MEHGSYLSEEVIYVNQNTNYEQTHEEIPGIDTRINWIINYLHRPVAINLENTIIGLLSLFAFFSRFIDLGARVMSHDESLHVFYSWQLASGGGFVHTPMMHGPLLFELTAFINALFGANDFTSRFVPAILGTLIVIVIPQLLKKWLGRTGAILGSILFVISPYMLYYSRYIRHDTIVIAWLLLALTAILGYLHSRKELFLFVLTIALALMFSTMEITFIYLAILASFLFARLVINHGFHWKEIREAAEFDLLILMVALGAFFSSTIFLPILNPIFNKISGKPFVDLAVLGSQGPEWVSGPYGIRLIVLFVVVSLLGTVIGYVWGRLRWIRLALIFLIINVSTFTTLFTNPSGLASGFIGSLGYWLSQQGVARGGQPWYYFLIVFPIYEYLPILGGMAAAIYFSIKRKSLSSESRLFVPLLVWWAVGIFSALSLAGEKMPWLSTHIVVPFILLTAWLVGQITESRTDGHKGQRLLRQFSLIVFLLLALLTVRTSVFANYVNYDYSTEFIDYAHGAPGVKWVMKDIEEIANHTGAGKDLKIAFDDEVAWPMSWYLKNYPNRIYFGSDPNPNSLDAPVVIAGPKNWQKVEMILGSNYHRFEVIRMWWPIEDYKNLSLQKILNALGNPEMRSALWDILWNRDYTKYSALTGASMQPPSSWPLNEKMRVFVRKDIALQMLSFSLGKTILPESAQAENAYASITREETPIKVIQLSNVNNPRNLAVAKDGSIYVADTGNSRMVKFNPKGEKLLAWGGKTPDGQQKANPGTFNEPWGIALDADQNVLVVDTWNHRIQKFSPDGKFIQEWGTAGVAADGMDRFWGPRGIAVSKAGVIYVTDTGNKRVIAFSPEGKALFMFDSTGDAALNEPVGIAVSPDGNVLVADTWNLRVAIFSPAGKYITSFSVQAWTNDSLENKPYIAADQSGQVYITDPGSSRVIRFSPEGKPLFAFGKLGMDEKSFGLPIGIAADSEDRIWVIDSINNRLEQFSLSGQ